MSFLGTSNQFGYKNQWDETEEKRRREGITYESISYLFFQMQSTYTDQCCKEQQNICCPVAFKDS